MSGMLYCALMNNVPTIWREQRAEFPLDSGAVQKMWRMFADLGEYEANAIDTTGQAAEESANFIQKRLEEGDFRI